MSFYNITNVLSLIALCLLGNNLSVLVLSLYPFQDITDLREELLRQIETARKYRKRRHQ
ncbi:MAG: hypothetical protein D4R93_00050 [Deltaproteobacteria bacterium]|nr:MAG: hypothetical protein D4R93_00050 [Deltaproteobacteria bacterium]